ncbi:MAG: response regulator transcription factor [Prolixibacteraceae bacterium]|nr:response regulator transcription factor [Prolixibacteraceae bacterium]MBN2775854.1 response regulator transcription factor [Prolixibacteraceae bacterium]
MAVKCLIVDDEPLAQDVLKDYVESCPELELVMICNDALEAGDIVRKENIDLLFLDINMPRLTGINFVKSLSHTPLFILITAYPEFAIEGFEVEAVDYLLKPVPFERFRKAVNRALERLENRQISEQTPIQHILVKADKKNYRIEFNNLLFLEAMGDYVRFYMEDKKLMVHGTLKEIVQKLPEKQFIRIHKSFIVNISKVNYIEGNMVKLGNEKIPVSLTYREEFFKIMNNK